MYVYYEDIFFIKDIKLVLRVFIMFFCDIEFLVFFVFDVYKFKCLELLVWLGYLLYWSKGIVKSY